MIQIMELMKKYAKYRAAHHLRWPSYPLLTAGALFTTSAATLIVLSPSSPPHISEIEIPVAYSCNDSACRPKIYEPLLEKNTLVSYYGHPKDARLGAVGEYSIEDLIPRVQKIAAEYDALNGEKGALPALHLIYALVHPDGSTTLLSDDIVRKYINAAREHGLLVFLDHQIGAGSVERAMKELLRYASYENVHFALDPEWHTAWPGNKIGSVSAKEIDSAQEMIQNYLEKSGVGGKKILVVHQFRAGMITSLEDVHADFTRTELVHDMDGFGKPHVKRGSYAWNARAEHIPLKGIKLFFPSTRRDWGYDEPLMTPAEILALEPQPVLIIYQ
jgi:hypothetical protein